MSKPDLKVLYTDPETGIITIYELGEAVYQLEPLEPPAPWRKPYLIVQHLGTPESIKESIALYNKRGSFRGKSLKKPAPPTGPKPE